jgi:glycerol-3-phosphate acyltransferase PlsX
VRFAIDAMGGDYAPREVVRGALAARDALSGDEVVLVGDEKAIRAELQAAGARPERLTIVHASQNVAMDETPVEAIRKKPDSSMRKTISLMVEGRADAAISAGNTGAFVAAAMMVARRLPGVRRPGIAVIFPTLYGPVVLIDVGANVDSRPTHLLQYAAMASIYAQKVIGIPKPRVGLLSIGEEGAKGNDLARQTRALLEKSPLDFRGNAEGRGLFSGRFDVVVCDGFVGNVVLKTVEAMAENMFQVILAEMKKLDPAVSGLLMPVVADLKRRHDADEYGGAILLGVAGVVVICHGNSNARAIANSFHAAATYARTGANQDIIQAVARMGEAGP